MGANKQLREIGVDISRTSQFDVRALYEQLEPLDRDPRAASANRLVNLAEIALNRAAAVCRGEVAPSSDDVDHFLHVAMSMLDPRGPDGYMTSECMNGALVAMLRPTFNEMGLTITPTR